MKELISKGLEILKINCLGFLMILFDIFEFSLQ